MSVEQPISLVTLGVDDLDHTRSFYEALGWRGARQTDREVCFFQARADWGGFTGAFADPDGYVWEVAYNPDWKIEEDGSIRL